MEKQIADEIAAAEDVLPKAAKPKYVAKRNKKAKQDAVWAHIDANLRVDKGTGSVVQTKAKPTVVKKAKLEAEAATKPTAKAEGGDAPQVSKRPKAQKLSKVHADSDASSTAHGAPVVGHDDMELSFGPSKLRSHLI